MHSSDDAFDPDDNFAGSFSTGMDVDDEDSDEALVWQLLLLINPGDEDAALQQFEAWQEALVEAGDDEVETAWLLKDAIDWRSGFHVDDSDRGALIDAINELAARFNLDLEWGVEDPTDAQFLAATAAATLIATAYDRLREHDYTLWTWNTGEDDSHAGWITRSRDDEAMQAIAAALGIELRRGFDAA